jgi:hypothetical protein
MERRLEAQVGDGFQCGRLARAAQRLRQQAPQGDRAQGRGIVPGGGFQVPRQPAGRGAGIPRDAALHRRHRFKVRKGLVIRAAGVNHRDLPRMMDGKQGREGRVQAEVAVNVQHAVCGFRLGVAGPREGEDGPVAVVIVIPVRDDDAEAVHAAAQEDRDERVAPRPDPSRSDCHAAQRAASSGGPAQRGKRAQGE